MTADRGIDGEYRAAMAGSGVIVGTGISTARDPHTAATEAALAAGSSLGRDPDLVLVFAAGAHLTVPEATLDAVNASLSPGALVGCGAGGVLARRQEREAGTAIAVWAATLGDGGARPFGADVAGDGDEGVLIGLPECSPDAGLILLSDPSSFPTDAVLSGLSDVAPGVPVVGGLASGRTRRETAALFLGEEVRDRGAVGVVLEGVEMIPCVSQGAAPLGRELTITAAEGNVIQELAGRPAIESIEAVIGELSLRDRALVAGGLLIGIVIDSGHPEYEQGDFLVRGVLGADPATGAVAVGAQVEPGQIVRVHARDAGSAGDDLQRQLRLRSEALGGRPAAGALVFTCNGRGRAMFGAGDHDATAVESELRAPAAGFFAAGEIGPVSGRSFVHAFTATVAVFPS
jgi:small ligand-binding sensory domain FIST